jgi:hypothetical protein
MPKIRPRLRAVRESENQTKKQKPSAKLHNLQIRYSHIPISKANKNTLYLPIPSVKRTKRKPIQPSGSSWNLMIEELKKPIPKKIPYRKFTETLRPIRPTHSRPVKPNLKHRITTKNENLRLLQKELNSDKKNPENRLDSPLGTPLGSKI